MSGVGMKNPKPPRTPLVMRNKKRLHTPLVKTRNSNGLHIVRVIRIERVMRTHAVELTLPEGVGL